MASDSVVEFLNKLNNKTELIAKFNVDIDYLSPYTQASAGNQTGVGVSPGSMIMKED